MDVQELLREQKSLILWFLFWLSSSQLGGPYKRQTMGTSCDPSQGFRIALPAVNRCFHTLQSQWTSAPVTSRRILLISSDHWEWQGGPAPATAWWKLPVHPVTGVLSSLYPQAAWLALLLKHAFHPALVISVDSSICTLMQSQGALGWKELKNHAGPTPLKWTGTHSIDQVVQNPIPPGLEHFQEWCIQHFSEQPVPVWLSSQ